MLVDINDYCLGDDDFLLLSPLFHGDTNPLEIARGIYKINHFGGTGFLPGLERHPELKNLDPSGVCDNYEQIFEKESMLQQSERKFLITLHEIIRAEQPPRWGWRWKKWGKYIGEHDPQHEFIYDEAEIDIVYCYHIYEDKTNGKKNEK